jgi:predicted glycosyltransferase
MASVLFYVQHLIGVGHLKRAARLARALREAGLSVTLVSGGMPALGLDPGGAEFVQLPPARAADETFRIIVQEDGRPVDDAWRAGRRAALEAAYARTAPRVLMVEMFPFGRRHFRFELVPLLESAVGATSRPWIVCSVRDILVEASSPDRYEEMAGLAERFFDRVLVHGDPELIPFEKTFPLAARIAGRVHHTGYVMPAAEGGDAPRSAGEGEVIVSAGSRAMGEPLLKAAMEARELTPLAHLPWRLLARQAFPAEKLRALQEDAPAGVRVEPFRPDFVALLAGARLCICQGGYNTTLEALAAGVPTVIAPHGGARDAEQGLRARLLAERGLAAAVPDDETLDGASLAAAVARALELPVPRPAEAGVRMEGAAETARIVAGLARRPWSDSAA